MIKPHAAKNMHGITSASLQLRQACQGEKVLVLAAQADPENPGLGFGSWVGRSAARADLSPFPPPSGAPPSSVF
jgi:hypothetical protein